MSFQRPGRVIAVLASGVVAASLAAALWTLGKPGAQRDVNLDERREKHLQQLEYAIQTYWRETRELPASLDALAARPGMDLATADPVHGTPYGYRVTGDGSYQVCASFATDSAQARAEGRRRVNHKWPHGIGEACFDRIVEGSGTARAGDIP